MISFRTSAIPRDWQYLLQRYWTICKGSFQERMQYRWNIFIYLIQTLLPGLVAIYLWRTILRTNNNIEAERYITTYYIVATFVQWRIARYDWMFMNDIKEGRLATALLRPMSYPASMFWYEAGGRTWSTIFTFPVFILVAVLFGSDFQLPPDLTTWLLAIAAFMLAYLISFFLTASLGLITIWQNQPESFFYLYDALSRWLGGTLIPLTLMPIGLGVWLRWLPFAFIYSLPARIFLGMPVEEIWQGFLAQAGWVVGSAIFFCWLWRKAIRRYEVFEG